ncbi:hypothetical protein NPIL_475101 [Nephila pilipes]|uniref:DUF5641 domain-containing protein n=1 Tax=Nephila pilipes TaxID=299642 RepID=A0A8X6QC63_NEPPI|nr:hypothetical protein NPIL_475101 [Nephila pilipes]
MVHRPGSRQRNRIKRLDESLVAVETILGFCVLGSISEDKGNDETWMNLAVSKESISEHLSQFWHLENLDIEKEEDTMDISEHKILKSFESSIEHNDNELHGFIANKKVLWKFIADRAPWWGGDDVLVEGATKSKLLWQLGRIQEVLIERDNNARTSIVKTPKGIFRRPIQMLYPLELDYA